MAVSALVDTGAILAVIDHDDRWHAVCTEAFAQLRLPLLCSEAVLTELFYLVDRNRVEMEVAWEFVHSNAIALATIEQAELTRLRNLMSRYRDRPMDFADATLVYLAERESMSTVFTVHRADFETYRIAGKRRFRIVPELSPRS